MMQAVRTPRRRPARSQLFGQSGNISASMRCTSSITLHFEFTWRCRCVPGVRSNVARTRYIAGPVGARFNAASSAYSRIYRAYIAGSLFLIYDPYGVRSHQRATRNVTMTVCVAIFTAS